MSKETVNAPIQKAPIPAKPCYTLDELLAESSGMYPLPPEEREWVDAPAVGREQADDDN